MSPLQRLYQTLEGASWEGCATCGACCSNPWLLPEEDVRLGGDVSRVYHQGIAFLAGEPCRCLSGTHCQIYPKRPLDCRLYPLDLVEEGGEIWWCIFEDCKAPDTLAAILEPRIPALEAAITPDIFQSFQAQIKVTRHIWQPYAQSRYRKLRKLTLVF